MRVEYLVVGIIMFIVVLWVIISMLSGVPVGIDQIFGFLKEAR